MFFIVSLPSLSYDSKIGLFGVSLSIDPAAVSVLGDHDVNDTPYNACQQFGVSLE